MVVSVQTKDGSLRQVRPAEAAAPRAASFARDGDLDFDVVFRGHFARVARTLGSLGVGPAWVDDATQDVFVIVHAKLAEFEGRSSLATWIYAVTYRVAQNYRRRARMRAHAPLTDAEVDPGEDPAEIYAREQAADFMRCFCTSLAEEKRDAFVLCVVEERPVVEVAEVLGVSVNTLYSRIRAARSEFRKELRRFVVTNQVKETRR